MTDAGPYILGIESAIAGGSISLLENGVEIEGLDGGSDVSRAEDLMVNIDRLLRDAEIKARDLEMVAVSAGPGSFTGIRIGLATAMGLTFGSGSTLSSCSVMQAAAFELNSQHSIVAAVPMGRGAVCVQRFGPGAAPISDPETVRPEDLARIVSESPLALLHPQIDIVVDDTMRVVRMPSRLSLAVARFCRSRPTTVEPIFISKSF